MEILTEALQETSRLILAGAALAPGDFRIKKLLPSLEEGAKSAPVLGRIAQTLNRACGEGPISVGDVAEALMEAHTLITAVAATQATVGIDGDFTPLTGAGIALSGNISFAKGFAAVQALTTTGSGRVHVLDQAWDEGILKDLRLLPALLEGLGDGYPEVAELAEKALSAYGRDALLVLKNSFDPNGGSDQARRFVLLNSIGAFTQDELRHLAMADTQEVTTTIRTGAIKVLGTSINDEGFFLALVTDRKKDIRVAAAMVLTLFDSPQAVEAVVSVAVKENDDNLTKAMRLTKSPSLSAQLLERVQVDLDKAVEEIAQAKPDKKVIAQALSSITPLPMNDNSPSLRYLSGVLEKLNRIKHSTALEDLAGPLLVRLLDSGKDARMIILEASLTKKAPWISFAFFASLHVDSPQSCFSRFETVIKKDKKDPEVVALIKAWQGLVERSFIPLVGWPSLPEKVKYDTRWMDEFFRLDEPAMVCYFQVATLPSPIENYLISKAGDPVKNSDVIARILENLARVDSPKALDLIVNCWMASLTAKSKRWELNWAAESALEELPAKRAKDLRKRADNEPSPDLKAFLLEGAQSLEQK